MKPGLIVKSISDLNLIQQFIDRGARVTTIMAQFTHVPEAPIREMYHHKNGSTSRRGLIPHSTLTLLKNLNEILHANTFYSIYRSFGDDIFKTINAKTMILAYDQYKEINAKSKHSLDFEKAWYIARDLRSNRFEVKFCKKCGVERLFTDEVISWVSCPYCKAITRGQGRAKRAALKKNRVKKSPVE